MGNSVVTIVKWQDGLAVLPLGRFFPEFYTPPCYTIFVGAQDVTGFCCFPSAWLDFLLIFTSYRLTFPAVARLNLGVFMYLLPSRHPTHTTTTTLTVPRRSTLPLARLKTCGLLTLFCHFSFGGLDALLSAVALSGEMHSKFQRVKRGDPVLGPHSPGSQFTVLFQVLGLSQSWLFCESLGPFCSCLTPTPLQYDLEK